MTPEEARKLLGGYATGSLSEAERTALFQAALEDQDLFDELAGEQVLKEVLDEPGARQRLIAALEPPRRHRAWLWVTAGATVAVAVVIGIVVFNRTPPPEAPQQIAQVMKSPEPVAAPPAPVLAPARAAAPEPIKPKVAAAPPPPAAPELQKAEAENRLADQAQQPKPLAVPQAAAGAVRQFTPAQNETVTVTQTIGPAAFTYAVGADGFLQIVAVETGFVSVAAEFTDRDEVIFPSSEVTAKATIRIQIPANATGLIIGFSKMPGVNDSRIGRPLRPGLGLDPNRPAARFRIEVPVTIITPPSLTPATR